MKILDKKFLNNSNIYLILFLSISFLNNSEPKDVKPFAKTNLPSFIKDITIKNAKTRIDKKTGFPIITGDLVIKKFDVHAEIITVTSQEGAKGLFLRATIPDDKLPDPFKKLKFKSPQFIISTFTYYDSETGLTFQKGLSFAIQIELSGILSPISKLLGGKKKVLTFESQIGADLMIKQIGAAIGGGLDIKSKKLSLKSATLQLSNLATPGGSPQVDISIVLDFKPTPKDQTLSFIGILSLSEKLVKGLISYKGMWKNPFGIKGFSIGDLGLGLGFNPETFPEDPMPSEFELAGKMKISDKTITFALRVAEDLKKMALLGKLDGTLSISEIVVFFANKMGAKIPKDKVPKVALKDVEVKFAPATTYFGAIIVRQGLTLKGELDILKEKASIDFNIDTSGITAKADMSPIKFGPLKVTAGKTAAGKIRKTKFGGPEIDIELTFHKQKFLVTGLIALAKLAEASADINISKKGIDFNFEAKIGKELFDADIKGQSSGPINNPDFKLHIDFKQKFMDYIHKELEKALKGAEDKVKKKIGDAQKKVEDLQKQIDDTQKKIDELKKKLKGGGFFSDIGKALKKTGEKIKKSAQKFGKEIKKTKIGKTATKTANKGKYGTEIAALESKKVALQASKKIAERILKAAEQTGVGTLEAGRFVVKSLTKGLNVKEIKFDGSLHELEEKKLPHLFFDVVIAGKEHKINFDYDFSDVGKSAKKFTEMVLKKIVHYK